MFKHLGSVACLVQGMPDPSTWLQKGSQIRTNIYMHLLSAVRFECQFRFIPIMFEIVPHGHMVESQGSCVEAIA